MPYNVDHSYYLNGQLTIECGRALRLIRKYKDELPESNLLEYTEENVEEDDDWITIDKPYWSGEGSGYTIDFFKEILSHTKGKADICLVWEGGDSITGLRVEDGKVTECKAVITLQPE